MKEITLGTVYGTLMNFRGEHEALAAQMREPPYNAPPKAPVLYVKPANTWSADGVPITVPAYVPEVEVGATIGMVMKAPGEVAGYLLMNDLSIPHDSFFRPPVKFKCIDGFLAVSGKMRAASPAVDPARFVLDVYINGSLRQTVRFADLVRPAQQLLADVSEFMTLGAGDVLMLGCDWGRPRARPLDRVDLVAEGLGTLGNILAPENAA
jgi:5-oxopent-3-ene-1,2,5-tricarboxylate decarboxylase/2-hydroxyhepta-2,4-diene-1,7-dioate isomerase